MPQRDREQDRGEDLSHDHQGDEQGAVVGVEAAACQRPASESSHPWNAAKTP
jgi:hypothetical protein